LLYAYCKSSSYLIVLISSQDFKRIADELLWECHPQGEQQDATNRTPLPGQWDVIGTSGIIKDIFWDDLVEPGSQYSLVPRAPAPKSAPLAFGVNQLALRSNHSTVSSSSSYNDTTSPVSQEANFPTTNYFAPKTYAQCLSKDKDTNDTPASQGAAALTTANISGFSSAAPPLATPWATHARKNPLTGTLLKITLRDDNCAVIRTINVPKNLKIGEVIQRLGGTPGGSRVQTLVKVDGGFRPGLSYMWGTQKTVREAGWDEAGSNISLCLIQQDGSVARK
jgi:hypothetical protein